MRKEPPFESPISVAKTDETVSLFIPKGREDVKVVELSKCYVIVFNKKDAPQLEIELNKAVDIANQPSKKSKK